VLLQAVSYLLTRRGIVPRITEGRGQILQSAMEVASDLEAKGGIVCALLSWQAQLSH
jgi:hypothetical protein